MLTRWLEALRALRWRYAAAALSGVLYFVGFCGFDQWYLAWICLVPMLWALDDAALSKKAVLAIAWCFGLTTHLGGYPWIIGLLKDFAYMPLPLAFGLYVLLCLAQGSLLAAWGYGTHYLVHRRNVPLALAAPVMMVVCEWLYPALFPSYLSNSQYQRLGIIQSLDLWGPLGLTFLLVLASVVVYETADWFARHRKKAPLPSGVACVALVIVNAIYGAVRLRDVDDTVMHADKQIKVGIVQTNMGIYQKHLDPNEGLRRHREQSLEVIRQGAELVVWPESGYNMALPTGVLNVKEPVLGPIDKPLLFGGLRVERHAGEKRRRIYNSAYLTDGEGNVMGTYDKTYLLAFGEYLPFGDVFPSLYDLSPQSSNFSHGERTEPLVLGDVKWGVLICYEDVLPSFVRKVMEKTPDVLVNITNDSWFGKTREPYIHLALAAFRAVEERRFLVRATNSGVSAFIDPVGRIVSETPTFARANLVGEVAPMHGRTVYAVLGDWPGYLSLAALLLWLRHVALAKVRVKKRARAAA